MTMYLKEAPLHFNLLLLSEEKIKAILKIYSLLVNHINGKIKYVIKLSEMFFNLKFHKIAVFLIFHQRT